MVCHKQQCCDTWFPGTAPVHTALRDLVQGYPSRLSRLPATKDTAGFEGVGCVTENALNVMLCRHLPGP